MGRRRNLDDAISIYQDFWWDIADNMTDFIIPNFSWPKEQECLGLATRIGYRSNKADRNIFADYIHKHEKPLPRILCKYSHGKKVKDPVLAPSGKRQYFTFLGYCLDLEFIDSKKKKKHIDWKEGELPFLGWNKERNCLIVQDHHGTPPIIIHSDILTVTKRGIEK